MISARLLPVLRQLEQSVSLDGGSLTDGQLLDCFISARDEAAFSALVRRHGPMVLGVCRRVVGHEADAEDAFQATFLVLVRKAASIAPRERVGNWLHGVAYRTALEARTLRARRLAHETLVPQLPDPVATPRQTEPDWQPLLDEELSRLPDKYRSALVLCDLEGRSRKEAAEQLNVPAGTLSSRLATARKLLAQRLGWRGLACSAAFLVGVPTAVSAAVPAALLNTTVRTGVLLAAGSTASGVVSGPVAALAKGVLQTMALVKIRVLSILMAAIVLLAGASMMLAQSPAKPAPKPPTQPPSSEPIAANQGDLVTQSFRIHEIHADKGLLTVFFDGNVHAHLLDFTGLKTWMNIPTDTMICTRCHVSQPFARWTTNRHTAGDRLALDMIGEVNRVSHLLELQVRPTTRIIIDGKDRKLGDLKTGISVEVVYRPGAKPQAVSITAHGKSSAGVVSEIDLDTSTLTLQQEEEGRDEIVESDHVVVKDARIVINGKPARLEDLKPGMRVSVEHSAVKPVLVSVTAAGPRVEGVLTAIDPKKMTLTLNLKNIHLATGPVSIAANAKIQVNGRDATVADLKPGMRVTLRMAAESDRSTAVGISTVRVVRKPSGD
jgi:RNA polymerase sigma factor (sigma-70 family)